MAIHPILEIVLRAVTVYLFILIAIRISGKRELAQLSVIDLVFILLISNAVQNAMVGPDSSLLGGLIAAAALFLTNYILKLITYYSPKFNKLLQGSALLLIYQGKLNPKNLAKARLTQAELEEAIREHGVSSIAEVDLAVLEIDGNISVLSHEFQQRTMKRRRAHKVLSRSESN
jgi:uncharacterized membrane protein YcaP (DUF421 family)